ncbi:MAG: DUF2239 family protein [Acidobacteria bacterium]|nr:DUF2239 family protein [Acidobacteriota bacterium]
MPTPQVQPVQCTAFEGTTLISSGTLASVALAAKTVVDRGERGPVLIFDDDTGALVEIDFRGTPEEVLRRIKANAAPETVAQSPEIRTPGRPRLGVVGREVTLLPRHWEWLNRQPGGASVALRKLVEEARRANEGKDRARLATEAAYRFIAAMAGNEPGFEEATRALFAGDHVRFNALAGGWPEGVAEHARRMAGASFAAREAVA